MIYYDLYRSICINYLIWLIYDIYVDLKICLDLATRSWMLAAASRFNVATVHGKRALFSRGPQPLPAQHTVTGEHARACEAQRSSFWPQMGVSENSVPLNIPKPNG